MTQAKHTPGPWSQTKNTPSLIEAIHHGEMTTIAQALEPEGSASIPDKWANARLIAAAPELLEALEAALRGLTHDSHPMAQSIRIKNARAAIAKAKEA